MANAVEKLKIKSELIPGAKGEWVRLRDVAPLLTLIASYEDDHAEPFGADGCECDCCVAARKALNAWKYPTDPNELHPSGASGKRNSQGASPKAVPATPKQEKGS